jgi:hypothetical protein
MVGVGEPQPRQEAPRPVWLGWIEGPLIRRVERDAHQRDAPRNERVEHRAIEKVAVGVQLELRLRQA